MAEDGMLINFDVGAGPFEAKRTLRGGSWKDRLTARKAATYHQQRKLPKFTDEGTELVKPLVLHSNVISAQGNLDEFPSGDRPAKKQRTDGDYQLNRHRPSAGSRPSTDGVRAPRHDGKPKEVVSSLFSFNPEAKYVPEPQQTVESVPAEPSNAPLSAELETFTSLGLSRRLADHLVNKMEIRAPTSIQKEAVQQLIKEDTDAFLQAETGSGKTLAYLLPVVQRIASLSAGGATKIGRDSGLFAIILAPTRELAKQISVVLEKLLSAVRWIVSGTVAGGENKKSEKERIRRGFNILVATPGRLADHLDHTTALDVSYVRWLILDEGDRLMELGFEKDLQKIISTLNMRRSRNPKVEALPVERTTVLCSATMKMDVQKLGDISLKDAVHLKATSSDGKPISDSDTKFSAPAQLQQSFAIVPAKLRLVTLQAVLKRAFARKGSVMKAIVFMSCADSVDFHFEVFAREKPVEVSDQAPPDAKDIDQPAAEAKTAALSDTLSSKDNPGVEVFRLHGSLPQAIRTSTLAAYTKCNNPAVLVCTDVASRGLDLPNIDLVIEYDPPFNKDDHLHRIGRTARAGRDGRAMIFLQPGSEEGYIDILKAERRDGGRNVTSHDSPELLKKAFATAGVKDRHEWEERTTDWQLDVERWVIEHPHHEEQARRAYQSVLRAYATHIAPERHIFDMSALHLGHLAKAFALRDKPGSIRVPGLRPSKASAVANKQDRRSKARAAGKGDGGAAGATDFEVDTDAREAARKMRSKMKTTLSGASEFNLG